MFTCRTYLPECCPYLRRFGLGRIDSCGGTQLSCCMYLDFVVVLHNRFSVSNICVAADLRHPMCGASCRIALYGDATAVRACLASPYLSLFRVAVSYRTLQFCINRVIGKRRSGACLDRPCRIQSMSFFTSLCEYQSLWQGRTSDGPGRCENQSSYISRMTL